MGTTSFPAAKLSTGTNAKLPNLVATVSSGEPSAKLPNGIDMAATTETISKLPIDANAKLPKQQLRAAERLRRLEEAMAFLRQHLAAGPQPARTLLKAANTTGIAERPLHRAKDLLGITTQSSGGYAGYGQWVWYPPARNGDAVPITAHEAGALVAERH